jgi:RNA recognition motif-containing protein
VRNLPDKLQKEDLKRNLYMLFATYGVILDVVALKTMKMRGQAHVVFRDVDSSTQAMRALQGFTFFGKDMVRLIFNPNNSSGPMLILDSKSHTQRPSPTQ